MPVSVRVASQTQSSGGYYDRYHNELGFTKVGDSVWEGGVGAHKVHVDEEAGPGLWRVVSLHTARIRLFEGQGAEKKAFDCAVRIATEKFSGRAPEQKTN